MPTKLLGTRVRGITDLSFAIRLGLVVATCAIVGIAAPASAQDDGGRREINVAAHDGAFHPARIEVRQNDLVKVTFTADDGPHSFNIDTYRIAKRARPGHPAIFEFRADQTGTFPYYCNLSEAGGPHNMRGEFIVRNR